MKNKKALDNINQKIELLLKQQSLSFDQPWISIAEDRLAARNVSSGTYYKGINPILLSITRAQMDYPKNAWLTFMQCKAAGGKVKKGASAEYVYFFKQIFRDKEGNTLDLEQVTDLPKGAFKQKGISMQRILKSHAVFNIAQTTGLPDDWTEIQVPDCAEPFELNLMAENIIKLSDVPIKHSHSNRAYYNIATDTIHLPVIEQFVGEDAYYETVFHELGHATGHESRLDRDMSNESKEVYAFEELVAELFSAYWCQHFKYEKRITSNAAYIASYLKIIKDDDTAFWRAASLATKAFDYMYEKTESALTKQ